MIPLTIPCDNKKWHQQIADNINKDHPNSAKVYQSPQGYHVVITESYSEYCKEYVFMHCKKKKEK